MKRSVFLIVLLLNGFQLTAHATDNAFIKAIQNGDLSALSTLSETVDDIDAADATGKNALMMASKLGDAALVAQLLSLGANPLSENKNGGTPLMFASISGDPGIIESFLERGASVDKKGSNGWGALMIATAKGHTNIVERLLAAGADVNTRDVYLWTPLHRVAYENRRMVLPILLSNRRIDIDAKDDQGATPLHHAAARGNAEIASALLQHGASPLIKDHRGRTAFTYATEQGHDTLAMLLKHKPEQVN